MKALNHAPFFRFLPFFIVGIYCGFEKTFSPQAIAYITCFVLMLIVFRILNERKVNYKGRWVDGVLVFLSAFLLGNMLVSERREDRSVNYFSHFNKAEYYTAHLVSSPALKGRNYRAIAEIFTVTENGSVQRASGHCFLYFRNDSGLTVPGFGEAVIFKGRPVKIEDPKNPGQFNFRRWASLKDCTHQFFLRKDDWSIIPGIERKNIRYYSQLARNHLLKTFSACGLTGREYAVLSALVLGYEDEIDDEMMNAYAASGTLHVLSVSGMHVGIIYMALNMLISVPRRYRHAAYLKAVIIISFLWFYAFLTGSSASVIRSAMMLSFIVAGNTLGRSSPALNSLSLSMVLIFLCFSPLMLFETGFQLSYLAVAGIAFVYPHINSLWTPEGRITGYVWSLLAVSAAAQLTTLPVSLYYFHQFPNYFLLANLLIIPISSVAIFAGIFLIIAGGFHPLAIPAGKVVSWIVYLLNESALLIERLPFAVTSDVAMSFGGMLLCYALITSVLVLLIKRETKWFPVSLAIVMLMLSKSLVQEIGSKSENKLCVYSSPAGFNLHVMKGFSDFVIADSSGHPATLRLVRDHMLSKGRTGKAKWINSKATFKSDVLSVEDGVILAGGMKILRMDSAIHRLPVNPVQVDALIITSGQKFSMAEINASVKYQRLIVCDERPAYQFRDWIRKNNELIPDSCRTSIAGAIFL